MAKVPYQILIKGEPWNVRRAIIMAQLEHAQGNISEFVLPLLSLLDEMVRERESQSDGL